MNESTEQWKQLLDEVAEENNLNLQSFEVKDKLHPLFWKNDSLLKEYIANRLYRIAKTFFQKLEVGGAKIRDVTITGSISNYTWSRYSDIDLHVLIDYKEVDENLDLVQEYLRGASGAWNRNHKIIIKGHEVEVYVQDVNEPHYSTGVYSLLHDRWLTSPDRIRPKIDYENVKKKAEVLMQDIDDVYESFAHKNYRRSHDEAEKLRDRIRKFRQSGLEAGGAFSVENLAFKVLRRNDYLKKLSSLRILSYDKLMSMNGS